MWYFGRDEAIFIGPLSVELKPPFEADLSPARKPLSRRVRLAFVWLFLSLFLVIPFLSVPFPAFTLVLVVPAVCVAILVTSLYWLKRERRVHFSDTDVSVRETAWGLQSAWSAPYAAFEGILLRERTLWSRMRTRTYFVVELKHPDPGRCLPLHITCDAPLPVAVWADAAQTLGLPSLIEANGGVVPYPAEHMTTPIRELANNRIITPELDPDEPAPDGLDLTRVGSGEAEAIALTLMASTLPLWLKACFAALVMLLALIGVLSLSLGPIAFALVLAGALSVAFWIEGRRPRTILITRQTLTLQHPWAGLGPASSFALPLDAITSIRGRDSPGGLGRELVIESDEGRMATGPGLDPAALGWLRRFLIATIASA